MNTESDVYRETTLHDIQHAFEMLSLLDEAPLGPNESRSFEQQDSGLDWDNNEQDAKLLMSVRRTGEDESACVRVISARNNSIRVDWIDPREFDFDYTHQIKDVLSIPDRESWDHVSLSDDDVLVNSPISYLFSTYHMWHAADLRRLAHAHSVHVPVRASAADLIETLDSHLCGRACGAVIVVFHTLARMRPASKVEQGQANIRKLTLLSTHSYLQVANEELRRSIIREWQNTIATEKFASKVCAPCGRPVLVKDITEVSMDDIDLSLLVNDALPPKVRPTTYNFDLYDHALLHPKGMTDRWQRSNLFLCKACYRELLVKHHMPSLCLANWLYYAYDELPEPAKEAFRDSTLTERLLVSRARASRISYRFTELRKKNGTDDTNDDALDQFQPRDPRAAASQRCVRGNILVMPQNSTHLNTVLPPPPEVVRDTVCAIYVGRSKPTKKTIGKFGPALARKTRVRTLIDFLVQDNIHYARDSTFHGLDTRNLDMLFDNVDGDDGVPCGIDIGFIQDSEVIRAAESDYTTRNVVSELPPEDSPLLMENVGYTMGDETPVSYQDMKMKALSHCLSGGKFVRSCSGDKFMPDFENPSLLTWLFPHLDPWGIGGFHEQNRTRPINMEDQLKYLLEVDDSPFQRDPDFAFVYYNILQKKAVCDSVRFRVKAAKQKTIIRDLMSTDKQQLDRLIQRFTADSRYEPRTDQEKKIVNLLNQVNASLHDIPGTSGYKLKMRNEIRALVNFKGTPAFFVTLNPSDVNHPLVRLLSGENIRLEDLEHGQELTEWDRKLLVAKNPGACAKFFHHIISTFISVVLRYGRKDRGLLGKCTAYYATVEAQARGTLHCHMLVWLYGHPNPGRMHDLLKNSKQYQQDMFTWLESLIKCELLGTTLIVDETIPKPRFAESDQYRHAGTHLGPSIDAVPESSFPMQFASSVNELVQQCNWHNHTYTCWKNLKKGEKRTDANCRMRIDGSTREKTIIDPDTGSIQLRRLHPWIANYNDVILFLHRANMDIKHIGSGEDAKALIYYVTDYITKASLPAHIGLSALLHAINRSTEKYKQIDDWPSTEHSGALTILVNSMLSRQEISHQQVMSYLVGGGDKYASGTYRILHFGSFERQVIRHWSDAVGTESDATVNDNDVHQSGHDVLDLSDRLTEAYPLANDQVTLYLRAGSITAMNQMHDYLMRPQTEPFSSMGLYEFVGMTEKLSRETDRRCRRTSSTPTDVESRAPGRPEEMRGEFEPLHPQHHTHMLRKRTVWTIPVILGNCMPRPDKSDEERELWARTVLTLFMPWRTPGDLKEADEDWNDAYDRQKHCISPEHMSIIHNMNVLNECRDARDKASADRAAARLISNRTTIRSPSPDPFVIFEANEVESESNEFDANFEPTDRTEPLLDALDKGLGIRFRHALDQCHRSRIAEAVSASFGTATLTSDERAPEIETERQFMREAKKKRRREESDRSVDDDIRNVRQRFERPPRVDCTELHDDSTSLNATASVSDPETQADIIRQVILEKNLLSNPEQLRAFEIVAHHVCFAGPQLLMYIGGVGGTGKSHVVNAILRLFNLMGKSNNILVAAPTGAAAILIQGHTIHSLTLLPDTPGRNLQELCEIWKHVDYLILDEISMISASFLSLLSSRLQRAKGTDEKSHDAPFGGINIIFTGDFAQLKPVRENPLYSHRLLNDPGLEHCRDQNGVSALMGVYLWRLVKTVVLLKRNQRQACDKAFADLLARIRVGECIQKGTENQLSDHQRLETRNLDRLGNNEPTLLQNFIDAPIIVGRKRIRDLLNLRLVEHHSKSLSTPVHLYHAKDRILRRPVDNIERDALWKLPSSTTNDSPGRVPLFPGMKVMVQENLAFMNRVVNGSEGTVRNIVYECIDGLRFPVVVYVEIPGSGRVYSTAEKDIIPIFPETSTFSWVRKTDTGIERCTVSRTQLPLLPAYSYTDYKSQGRSLDAAIVDPYSASTLQGIYVMLSRVRTMNGLAILRKFPDKKIYQCLSQELRSELCRLAHIDKDTTTAHEHNPQRVT